MAPSWAEYRALAQRVAAVAECGEAAGEEPCAELMRAMHDYLDHRGPVRPPSKASARRLNPPTALDGLSDDLVMRMFSRAPFMTHGSLHAVCRRLKTLLQSPEFLQQRVDSGLVEHGLVVVLQRSSLGTGGEPRGEVLDARLFALGMTALLAHLARTSGHRRGAATAGLGRRQVDTPRVTPRAACTPGYSAQ